MKSYLNYIQTWAVHTRLDCDQDFRNSQIVMQSRNMQIFPVHDTYENIDVKIPRKTLSSEFEDFLNRASQRHKLILDVDIFSVDNY